MKIKSNSKLLRFVSVLLVVALSVFAPPSLAANVFAGMLSAYLLGDSNATQIRASQGTVEPQEPACLKKVRGGFVIFEKKNGIVSSRFYAENKKVTQA